MRDKIAASPAVGQVRIQAEIWEFGSSCRIRTYKPSVNCESRAASVQSSIEKGQYDGGDFTFFTLSNFLLGAADLYVGDAPPTPDYNPSRGFLQVDFFPSIQDDWKVLPKLTLNLGLRWDFTTNPVGSGVPLEALVNPLTDSGFTVERHVFAQNPNWANFDPRLGIAYDPFADHKTSIRAGFGIFHEPVEARTYALGNVQSAPSAFIVDEPPTGGLPFPRIPNTPSDQAQGTSYSTNHAPYVIQYNLTLQRELFADAVASLAYIGSHGIHLFSSVNENLPIFCSEASAPLPSWCPAMPSGAPGSAGNPFTGQLTNPNFSDHNDAVPASTSRYNSLQASLNRQFGAGFHVQVSYSWSRCIDDGSSTYPLENSYGTADPYNRGLDRGPCSLSRTQNPVANALYSFPFHRNKLVSGWRLATLITASSGLPVNVADGYDRSLGGGEARPNYSGATGFHPYEMLNQPIAGPAIQYFNPACYTLEPLGTDGNVGRDSIYGPGLFNVDFSVMKRTRVTEKLDSEFRAEIFNLFDRANFGLPNPAVFTGPTGGQITTLATSPRQIQFAVRLLF